MKKTIKRDSTKTVTASELIEYGVPRSYFWNTDIHKKINTNIFIVGTLTRMHNTNTIKQFISYFGSEVLEQSFYKYRNRVNPKLLNKIEKAIKTPTL